MKTLRQVILTLLGAIVAIGTIALGVLRLYTKS